MYWHDLPYNRPPTTIRNKLYVHSRQRFSFMDIARGIRHYVGRVVYLFFQSEKADALFAGFVPRTGNIMFYLHTACSRGC